MFEAVLTICTGICFDRLLPGYEAATKADCEIALVENPPQMASVGTPECKPAGPALDMTQVAPGVFVHQGYVAEPDTVNGGDVSNLGFVIGETSVASFDSGTARWMGEALWRAIRLETDKPVRYAILSHTHPDHVLGASVLSEAGAEIVGHHKLARALADRGANYLESLSTLIGDRFEGTELPQVTLEVSDPITLDLGGRVLEVTAWPTAHTNSDLTLFDQQTATLFAGDLIFDQHIPVLDGNLRGWQSVLKDVSEIPAKTLVPGHGRLDLTPQDAIKPVQTYLTTLADETKDAIDSGERLGAAVTHIGQKEADNWMLFDAFNPRNATAAFTELEWE